MLSATQTSNILYLSSCIKVTINFKGFKMKIKVLFFNLIFVLAMASIGSSDYLSGTMKKAAKDGNIVQIEELIKKGEDINSLDDFGWSPLMWASYYNHSRLVEYLLNNGAKVNQQSVNATAKIARGSSALHIAAYYNFNESVKALLANKADINAIDAKGRTALLIASYYGHTEIVRTLIYRGADPGIPDDSKKTALDYAAKYSFTEIYELLTGKDIVTGKKLGREIETIRTYNDINIGWIDLNEERWKEFGYKSKGQWIETINFMNQQNMPKHFKEWIPEGKRISFVSSKYAPSPKNGLMIKFSDVQYVCRTSTVAKIMFQASAGSDTLDATIHFIDGQTGKEIYQTRTSVDSVAGGMADMGFEGRIYNCLYNLTGFISQKLQSN